jgi:manganese transport protein
MLSIAGDDATALLLVATQVVLSLQLPFALVPLIRFTASRDMMGKHANARGISAAAWIAAMLIVGCNAWLVVQTLGERASGILMSAFAAAGIAGLGLLVYLAFAPLRKAHDDAGAEGDTPVPRPNRLLSTRPL